MHTNIYYFSGTGNSLAVARAIAEKVNGTVMPISSAMDRECIAIDADARLGTRLITRNPAIRS